MVIIIIWVDQGEQNTNWKKFEFLTSRNQSLDDVTRNANPVIPSEQKKKKKKNWTYLYYWNIGSWFGHKKKTNLSSKRHNFFVLQHLNGKLWQTYAIHFTLICYRSFYSHDIIGENHTNENLSTKYSHTHTHNRSQFSIDEIRSDLGN